MPTPPTPPTPPADHGEQALSARLTSILALADEEADQRRRAAAEREQRARQVHDATRRRLQEVLDGLTAVEARLAGAPPTGGGAPP